MSEVKILVPVKIEALVVDSDTSSENVWKDFSLDYLAIRRRMGVHLDAGELKNLQSGLCEEGIHLHWALPAALTNGVHVGNEMVFPAVPNRWLIIRTDSSGEKKRVTKTWIVESDNAEGGTSPWVVQNTNGSLSVTKIGRATELNKWTAEGSRLARPLTAFAPGNPTFAAIYESCKNVFGFHDTLEGIDNGRFSYLVAGWYSDPAINPLVSAPKEIIESIKDKWEVKAGGGFPSDVLCHGFIHTVNWKRTGNYLFPERSTPVNVGVGFTSVDAKTAQIASQTGAAEQLLSAYFYDVLKNTEGAAEIDGHVGNRTFSDVDGGVSWEIRRTESSAANEEGKLKKDDFPAESKNPGLSAYFRELNSAQYKYNRLVEEKKSMQVEFRALCDKIIKDALDGEDKYRNLLVRKRELLQREINDVSSALVALERDILSYAGKVRNYDVFKVIGSNDRPEFELAETKEPRFWRPNDPVTLFSGPGVRKSGKYKSSGANSKLQCRTVSEVISGLVLFDGSAMGERNIGPQGIDISLKQLGSLNADRIEVVRKLYYEAILLDSDWVNQWAYQYHNSVGKENKLAEQMADNMRKMLNGEVDGNGERIRGLVRSGSSSLTDVVKTVSSLTWFLEGCGIQDWQHPWTPIHLIWYANWMPSYKIENSERVYDKRQWVWKDKRYKYTGREPEQTEAIQYSGKTILTDGVNGILDPRLPKGVADHNISQALASFSDALLMRLQSIQLPLLKEENGSLFVDHSFDPFLTNQNYFFPDVDARSDGADHFFPVRAGHLRITHLWITDAFGQVQKVVDTDDSSGIQNKVIKTGDLFASVQLKATASEDPFTFSLSPRIIQPSRLSFRWANAQVAKPEDSTADPATSPICGWVIPDFLSYAIDVYDAAGVGCGSVKRGKGDKLEWLPLPGSGRGATPESSIQNPFLFDFIKGLLGNKNSSGGDILREFFVLCTDRARYIESSSSHHDPGVAGLIGQPLALVRAFLKLELQGLPAQPQGWSDGFTPETKKIPTGLTGISFPVSLGDSRNSKDGLIGYFSDESGFEQMYTAYGSRKCDNSYFKEGNIELSFAAEEKRKGITLLMDPRGGVQADSGILPAKFIDLSFKYKDQSLKNIELHLLVAPFLGAVTEPDMPVSAEPGNSWTLLRKLPNGTWGKTPVTGQGQLAVNQINSQIAQEGYLVLRKDESAGR